MREAPLKAADLALDAAFIDEVKGMFRTFFDNAIASGVEQAKERMARGLRVLITCHREAQQTLLEAQSCPPDPPDAS